MRIGFHGDQSVIVVFFAGHVQQVAGITQSGTNRCERIDNVFKGFFFFAQILGTLRIVPDLGIFELCVDLFEFL
jgi:uncharacterized membrane protein